MPIIIFSKFYSLFFVNKPLYCFHRYVAEVLEYIYKRRKQVSGYRITWAPPVLRHFSAHLEPMPPVAKKEQEEDEDEELEGMEEILTRVRGMSFRRPSFQFIS